MIELTDALWRTMTRAFVAKCSVYDPLTEMEQIVGQVIADTSLVLEEAVPIEAFA